MNKITLNPALVHKAMLLLFCIGTTSATIARPSFSSRKFVAKHYGIANSATSDVHKLRINASYIDQIPLITADDTIFCSGGNLLLSCTIAETYQWYLDGIPIAGATSQTFSASVSGAYSVMATYGEGPNGTSANLFVKEGNIWMGTAGDSDWNNADNWSCGVVPTNTDHLIIMASVGFPIITGPTLVSINSLTLEDNAKLEVASGSTLSVTDVITVAANAELILRDEASLLQVNDVVNIGNITAEKTTAPMKRYDFTYWSSPVSGQTLHDLSPDTMADKYYSFSPTIGNWVSHLNGAVTMEKGRGYIVRAPQPFSATLATPYTDGRFIGTANNGAVAVPIVVGNSDMNLIGNPYPSAIDIDQFLLHPGNEAITGGTVYLWSHHSAPALIPGDNTYNYTSNDYASYNLLGGVSTTSGNNEKPTGKIASGQGFFIKGLINGQAAFDNSMRVAFANDQFFRSAGGNSVETTEKHRLWVNISNNQGAFKQTLVGYIDGATDATDRKYDGVDFNGNAFVNFYTIANEVHYNIQGRALPFNENTSIPLGYNSAIAGTFNISLDAFDGLFETQAVYLYDAVNDSYTDLKNGSHEFTTAAGTFNTRFELRFTNPTLGVQTFDNATIAVASADATLKIRATETINSVTVYDITGRTIMQRNHINANEIVLTDLQLKTTTVVLVKITLDNGQTTVRKAILE